MSFCVAGVALCDISRCVRALMADSRLPVVPHKAVAEVSEEETYRRGWLL